MEKSLEMISIATAHAAAAEASTIRRMIAQSASAQLICAFYELLESSSMMARIILKCLSCELRSKQDAANSAEVSRTREQQVETFNQKKDHHASRMDGR